MVDLLSHVLFAYAGVTVVSLAVDVSRAARTAALFGAIVPDVSKVGLFVDDDPLEALVGGSIEVLGWHTLLGVGLSIGIAGLLVGRRFRRTAIRWMAVGVTSHLLLDALLRTPTGTSSYALFWPVSGYRPPTPGLYLSGDPVVLVVAALAAGGAWSVRRHITRHR
ncbi:metal-dependent hydrolase [Halococcoides cellulosivorans]|uniref:Metal-dependent hydrolase n=1 Tax=Halococcoides cellulosivorans TaxID=1679096 RepID=A0A2R4WXY9_9EURY|nr:metal-dependent hydrolase [Halococcoides cellulosivorans]AWB26412.1 metal-dependent hydrolase [Halococcoides cellulosivorans]